MRFHPLLLLPLLALSAAAAGSSGGDQQIRLEDIERDTLNAARQRQVDKQQQQQQIQQHQQQQQQQKAQNAQVQQLKGNPASPDQQLYSQLYTQQQFAAPQQYSEQPVIHLRPEQLSAYLQRTHAQQAALFQQLYQPQAFAAHAQPQQALSHAQPLQFQAQRQHLGVPAQAQQTPPRGQIQQQLQQAQPHAQQVALAHPLPPATQPNFYQQPHIANALAAYSGTPAQPASTYFLPQGHFGGSSSAGLHGLADPHQQYLQLQLQQYLQPQAPQGGNLYQYQVAPQTHPAALQYASLPQQRPQHEHNGVPQPAVQYIYQVPNSIPAYSVPVTPSSAAIASVAGAAQSPPYSPAQTQYLQNNNAPKAVFSSGVKSTVAPAPEKPEQATAAQTLQLGESSRGFVPSTGARSTGPRHHHAHSHHNAAESSYSTFRRGRSGH